MYFYEEFDPAFVEDIKRRTDDKNQRLNFNNYNENIDTRWVGKMGELAFKRFLERNGVKYEYHESDYQKDEWDFTVGKLKIDVKTVGAKAIPKDWYACNVTGRQYDKIMREDNQINTLVFCRFVIPTNTAVILGWLKKDEFRQLAKFLPAHTKTGVITISADQYEVEIKELRSFISKGGENDDW